MIHHPQSQNPRRTFLRQLALGSAGLALGSRIVHAAGSGAAPGGRKLGVALVGLGSYATHQLAPALEQSRYCRLAAVVTGSRDKAQRWADKYRLPKTSLYDYATMDRLADNADVDVVYVVTPPGLHADQTIRAARAGKHVICEKPMAVSVAECDAMIAACREAKVHLSIGYRLHYHPMWQELMRLAHDEDFGPFLKMSGGFGFHHSGRGWRVEDRKLAGGGPLMDVGIYVIQGACMAKGDAAPVAVTAKEIPKKRPEVFREVEEGLNFTLEWADGAVCEATTSYETNSNRFRAEAAQGFFEMEPAYTYSGLVGRTSRGKLPPSDAHQQAAQIDGIAEAILAGTPSAAPGEMGRRDMTIVEAVYASAQRGGARVAVAS